MHTSLNTAQRMVLVALNLSEEPRTTLRPLTKAQRLQLTELRDQCELLAKYLRVPVYCYHGGDHGAWCGTAGHTAGGMPSGTAGAAVLLRFGYSTDPYLPSALRVSIGTSGRLPSVYEVTLGTALREVGYWVAGAAAAYQGAVYVMAQLHSKITDLREELGALNDNVRITITPRGLALLQEMPIL